ncbi:MAG: UDP-glucose 4-epimerase GalE [Phycisphaerales bacterium JB037]
MRTLVTGGAGYIGSHAVQRLLRDGHEVVVLDNLFRGHRAPIELLEPEAGGRLSFVQGDIGDRPLVEGILHKHQITTVMHFAALTYVGESVQQPLSYYRNNTAAALSLIEACDATGVDRFVFSSTAATYGEPPASEIPIRETCPTNPINPYGASKLAVERILDDWTAARQAAGKPVAFAALRYFNVAGCDRSGLLGEDHEPETHLIPVVLEAVLGKREAITIFGTDYDTPDGTCVRDYVHVEDLVDAHVAVLNALQPGDRRRYNLGIGKGYSVREIIESVKRVTSRPFEIREGTRRPGDPPTLYADPAAIQRDLNWRAQITDIDEIVESAWRWFRDHPAGYAP